MERTYLLGVRKLWPFLGIALAVAVGMALAPYVWTALGIAAVGAVACLVLGLLWIIWQPIKRAAIWAWEWFLAQGFDPDG